MILEEFLGGFDTNPYKKGYSIIFRFILVDNAVNSS